MDINTVERLIENVKVHEFLYDLNHADYKNSAIKADVWNSIGNEINLSGEVVKQKWRTLRDGYTRYKKQMKRDKKKNIHYLWASQLSFLDRPQTSIVKQEPTNVALKQENIYSPPASSPGASPVPVHFLEYVDTTPTSSSATQNALHSSNKRARLSAVEEENEDKIIDFLNSNKEYDRIDLLFLSYADTFKRFPPREQAIVKLELAKLFANTELKLLNDSSNLHHFQSQPGM